MGAAVVPTESLGANPCPPADHAYSVLVVRLVDDAISPSDLTARARIRDAAIACFAETGFDASFRTIAARAGVSPGLINHHFGSKASLRATCDEEVLRRFRAMKADGIADPSGSLLAGLTDPGAAAPVLVYLLRAVHDGGTAGRAFLDHLVDSAREAMAAGVASGLIRPSRDEEARVRYLTYQAVGALLVELLMSPHATAEEFAASATARQRAQMLPTLELFTEGLLTTRDMLEEYLLYVGDPPETPAS